MYWLRLYELMELSHDHQKAFAYFDDPSCIIYAGPGFLNAVNRFYGYRVWR